MKQKARPKCWITSLRRCIFIMIATVLYYPDLIAEERSFELEIIPGGINVVTGQPSEIRLSDEGESEETKETSPGDVEGFENEESALNNGKVYISQNRFAQEQSVSGVRETRRLSEITVIERKPVTAASSKEVREKDFELLPKNKPSDLLRVVPGLITLQHQGGGKADQFLLRGFNADHGTDVALFVDQVPVNLRSHAHGQGYADLHNP